MPKVSDPNWFGIPPVASPSAPRLQPSVPSGPSGMVGSALAPDAASCNSHWRFFSEVNKKWVSAELGDSGIYYGMLRARASSVGPWEDFTLCNFGTYYTLQSNANHKYVSVEVGDSGIYYGVLRARASSVGPWEKLRMEWVLRPAFWLVSEQSFEYVSAELGYPSTDWKYGMLRARAPAPGDWEAFSP